MKSLGIFDVKTRLSEICESVARTGETVLVTRRGKPFVRIAPLEDERGGSAVWEARRAYAGVVAADEFPALHRDTEPPYTPFADEDR